MPGQIVRRGENIWLIRIPQGRDARGTRKYHNHTVHGTKKDAERYRTRVLRELDTHTFVEASQQAVGAYLAQWLNDVAARRVSRRTLEDYRAQVTKHLAPDLGHLKLSQLGPAQIQKCYSRMQDEGRLSARSVRYAHSVLHSALDQAVLWQMLAKNPAKAVALPKVERKEMTTLDRASALALVNAARGTRFEALWVLLLTTGLRPGEALGLKWSDIRDDRVRVQRALVWHSKGEFELKDPKTPHARRTVSLPSIALQSLASHKARQAETRLLAGPEWRETDLVFCSGVGGPLEWRLIASRYFSQVKRSAGIARLRPYDLRHSCASLLLAAGENIKVVSERLGHKHPSMTLEVYSHVVPDMQQGAAERMDALLAGENQAAKSAAG